MKGEEGVSFVLKLIGVQEDPIIIVHSSHISSTMTNYG